MRVIADFGADYMVDDGTSSRRAVAHLLKGSPRSHAAGSDFVGISDPAVGDWVFVDDGVITEVLPRRTVFSRRAAGNETREQVLAANVDVAFVVASATDVNMRRIERYLTIAWQSGATPVVVVTKADLAEVEEPELPARVIVTSSVTGQGVDAIREELQPDRTGVLMGPSGAGKSTLINALLGAEVMRTREVHKTGEGRHMTSHRQLLEVPGGGAIIDTPGLREAQLWVGEDALAGVFEDIEQLASQCRFSDCTHDTEPGCAVKTGVTPERLRSYRKLQRELRAVAAKSDFRLRQEDRKKWKQIATAAKRARW